MRVTQDDLLDALREALQQPAEGEGQTFDELRVAMGCGEDKLRRVLKLLATQQRLEILTVRRTFIDGRTMPITGYRIKP